MLHLPENMRECLRFVVYDTNVCNWVAMWSCLLCYGITPKTFLTARLMPQSHEVRWLPLKLPRALMQCIADRVQLPKVDSEVGVRTWLALRRLQRGCLSPACNLLGLSCLSVCMC